MVDEDHNINYSEYSFKREKERVFAYEFLYPWNWTFHKTVNFDAHENDMKLHDSFTWNNDPNFLLFNPCYVSNDGSVIARVHFLWSFKN